MKKAKLSKTKLMVVAGTLSLLPFMTPVASAQIPGGYFEGNFLQSDGSDDSSVRVWIQNFSTDSAKKDQSADGSSYALIENMDTHRASLYRLDELKDGTEMWVQFFQNNLGLAEMGLDSTYTGVSGVDTAGTPRIRLTPTGFGQNLGCKEEIKLHQSSGSAWEPVPDVAKHVEGDDNSAGEISSKSFTGRFTLDGKLYSGTFEVDSLFPGAAVLHAENVSETAVDGHVTQNEITAVVAVLRHGRFILSDYDEFMFLRLEMGQGVCLSVTRSLGD